MSEQTKLADLAGDGKTPSLSCDGLHQVDGQAAGLLRDLVFARLAELGHQLAAGGDPGRDHYRNLYGLAAIHDAACEQIRSRKADGELHQVYYMLNLVRSEMALYRNSNPDRGGHLHVIAKLLDEAVEQLGAGH